jgi:hypothetical protein
MELTPKSAVKKSDSPSKAGCPPIYSIVHHLVIFRECL